MKDSYYPKTHCVTILILYCLSFLFCACSEDNAYIKEVRDDGIGEIEEEIDYTKYLLLDTPIYKSEPTGRNLLTTMNYMSLYKILDSLALEYPDLFERNSDIGRSVLDNEIRTYQICNNKSANKRIIINTGTHGDEKSSALGVTLAIKDLLEIKDCTWVKSLLKYFSIIIIPCLNPDGFNNCTRANANCVDINRDFVGKSQPETQAICSLIESNIDELYALYDFHNTTYVKGYGVTMKEYPLYREYYEHVTTLDRWFCQEWTEFFSSITSAPYLYMNVIDNTEGRLHYMLNMQYGKRCYTLEVPRNLDVNLDRELSSSEASKITKDMLINQLFLCWRKYLNERNNSKYLL